jgi:predicted O-methyltransferase YrrM
VLEVGTAIGYSTLHMAEQLSEARDLLFVDAAKHEYRRYIELAAPLLSERAVLVVDHMLMSGEVALPDERGHVLAQRVARRRPGAGHRAATQRYLARLHAPGGRRDRLRHAALAGGPLGR